LFTEYLDFDNLSTSIQLSINSTKSLFAKGTAGLYGGKNDKKRKKNKKHNKHNNPKK